MAESVMRQGLTTWLKAECENAGNSMIYAILGADIAQTEALRLTIPNLPPDQTVYIAENVDNLIRSAVSSMTNLPIDLLTARERQEVFEVKSEIEELLKAVRHPDVPGRPELMESLVGKLYGLNLVLRKMLLEKVVECQCGKPGGGLSNPGIKPTGYTKGQPIVIKSKAIYGWRAYATVERDDPEHNQVWVKEMPCAVKYEDIEEED